MSSLIYKRLYLPLASGWSIIAAQGIGHDNVVLTLTLPSGEDEVCFTLTPEEWKALSNMYYDLGIWAPLPKEDKK